MSGLTREQTSGSPQTVFSLSGQDVHNLTSCCQHEDEPDSVESVDSVDSVEV